MQAQSGSKQPGAISGERRRWLLIPLALVAVVCLAASSAIHVRSWTSPDVVTQLLYGFTLLVLVLIGVPSLLITSSMVWKTMEEDPWEAVLRMRPRWALVASGALLLYAFTGFVWMIVQMRLTKTADDPTALVIRTLSGFCVGCYAVLVTMLWPAVWRRK